MSDAANISTKEKRLSIRATDEEKAVLSQAAQARHMNVSQFVLQTSLDAANAILADQTTFRLTPAQWDTFCERIDEPSRTIPALQQLFAEHMSF